ncbi:MAG: succinate dehydrogenase assembly factor 2 [Pseudomonadota bacterium]|nr:succinate dehydrogenase assembly factor 2 [Pseudomonadota bacterium]|tara:strand:+ start:1683 stop:1925 length:243 start_codon:yes stop_codon:yes gene_type:complete
MSIKHNQIKWQCRRGLRELDLLFRKVIIEQLDSFENHELDLLEQVLKYEDQALFDFIFKEESLGDIDHEKFILEKIKNYV